MVDSRFYPFSGALSLAQLLTKAGHENLVELGNRFEVEITGADELDLAGQGDIALAVGRKYSEPLKQSNANVVVLNAGNAEAAPKDCIALVCSDPHAVFADMLDVLYPDSDRAGLTRLLANPDNSGRFEDDVTIAPNCVIGADVEIGSGTIIGPGTVIGAGVTIGRNCMISAQVFIETAFIGDGVFIQSGARIGTAGFGWLDLGKSNRKVPQLGRAIIQDNVQIGANTTIDRGALGDTVIGEGTKIDNLVQIGHNCRIGRYCLLAATTGLSGSTVLGDSVMVGGGVGSSGHLTVGSGSVLHGRTAVTKDWPAGSKLAGAPAQDIKDFWRELAAMRRLVKGD